jgi:hypothetical protein
LVLKHQCENAMSRLTITLSESRYRALKEASVQRDKTIGQLIDESLDHYGTANSRPANSTWQVFLTLSPAVHPQP